MDRLLIADNNTSIRKDWHRRLVMTPCTPYAVALSDEGPRRMKDIRFLEAMKPGITHVTGSPYCSEQLHEALLAPFLTDAGVLSQRKRT